MEIPVPSGGAHNPFTAGALNPKPCKKTFDLQSHMLQPAPYKLSPETNWAWMWSFKVQDQEHYTLLEPKYLNSIWVILKIMALFGHKFYYDT